MIVHNIFTETFNFKKNIQLLKDEIEIFNKIKLIDVNWLSSKENKNNKMYTSVVLSIDRKEITTKLFIKKIMIAELSLRTHFFFKKKEKESIMLKMLKIWS